MSRSVSLLLVMFVITATTVIGAPTVLSVFPSSQSIVADPAGDIIVDFDLAVDPTTITTSTFRVFGRWSGPAEGVRLLENGNTTLRFSPSVPFMSGEWVTVFLSHDIQDMAAQPMVNGYAWSFWTRTEPGTLVQPEVDVIPVREAGEAGIRCYGGYAGDLNNDGYSDLTIINEDSDDARVFLNDGSGGFGSFSTYHFPGGYKPSPSEGADFNADGFVDLVVSATGSNQVMVLLNNGAGGYLPYKGYTVGNTVRGLAVIDMDGDADTDIVTANRFPGNISLLPNKGNGLFDTAQSMDAGGTGEWGCVVADANNDGIQDIFIGANVSQSIILLLGDGAGGFTVSSSVGAGGATWMLGIGDVNNDGNVDVVSANSVSNNVSVIFGDGLGGLNYSSSYPAGSFPLAVDLGDLDGDGDLDMTTSSFYSVEFIVHENLGGGIFGNRRSMLATTAASCTILHDRDNDGDLDITGIDELADLIFLYENECCVGSVGSVILEHAGGDCDGPHDQTVDIVDLTDLIDHLFINFEPICCLAEADLAPVEARDGIVDVEDLTGLIDHLFITFPDLPACP